MAPPKKPNPQDLNAGGTVNNPGGDVAAEAKDPRAGSVAAPSPQPVIIEARLAAHVASALPMFGTQTVLRITVAKGGVPGVPRNGKIVDSMQLAPRGLEVVSGGERIIIGSGSWVT